MPNDVSARASLPARDFARGHRAPGFFFAACGEHGVKVGHGATARHYAHWGAVMNSRAEVHA